MSDKLPVVYVGPTSPKLGLVRLHQYTEPLNKNIQDAIEKYPALNALFIPLEQFRDRARRIYAQSDSSINHVAQHLAKTGVF